MLRKRYRRIVFFFIRVITRLLWWDLFMARVGFHRWAKRTREERLHDIAQNYRTLAVEMGGVLIKVGQFLSARIDVLPQIVTDELSGLQDKVPPEKFEPIRRLAERELGVSLAEEFVKFEEEPLAAASLGQVHRAKLRDTPPREQGLEHTGEAANSSRWVVVKVQRPNLEALINTDLAALRTVGNWLKRYKPIRKRADIPALLDELTRILYEEMDYLAEGRNAEAFRANFAGRDDVRVPRVIWSHTTRRVLTLEDVYAIKITDYEAITEAGVDRTEVAKRLFDVYLEQIFHHEFFHADPHPGNLFVETILGEDENGRGESGIGWRLTFVDFGMMGQIPPNTRAGLRELAIAVATQDAKRLVKSYQILGFLLPGADLSLVEEAEAAAFERFWGKSMAELQEIGFEEMHEFAKEFRGLLYDMPFQVPQDLILLGRCVTILSGMCAGLDPNFNLWESISPFAQELMAEEVVGGWEFWRDEVAEWVRAAVAMPKRLDRTLALMEGGKLEVQTPGLARNLARLESSLRRLVGVLLFAALLLGGVQLYASGNLVLGGILLGGAFFSLAWSFLVKPRRR